MHGLPDTCTHALTYARTHIPSYTPKKEFTNLTCVTRPQLTAGGEVDGGAGQHGEVDLNDDSSDMSQRQEADEDLSRLVLVESQDPVNLADDLHKKRPILGVPLTVYEHFYHLISHLGNFFII